MQHEDPPVGANPQAEPSTKIVRRVLPDVVAPTLLSRFGRRAVEATLRPFAARPRPSGHARLGTRRGARILKSVIPSAFGTPRALRNLNIAAVGLSLAALTASAFGRMGPQFSGLVTGAPTLLVGLLWAWILRLPDTAGKSGPRWGWLVSVPLAALNGALAGAAMMGGNGHGELFENVLAGGLLGASFGVIFWGPALVLTLVFFGAPIAWAQRLAKKGLAGEERGEWIIGGVCVLLSVVALVASLAIPPELAFAYRQPREPAEAGLVFMRVAGVLGLLAGACSTVLAWLRESRRRAFVARAEAGQIQGFRVDPTPEGKVLIRVSPRGEGYRVADFTEEVCLLDEEGRATEARVMALPR